MRKSGAGNLLMLGMILLVAGIFLISPIPKILGYISLAIGAVIIVIGLVRVFSRSPSS